MWFGAPYIRDFTVILHSAVWSSNRSWPWAQRPRQPPPTCCSNATMTSCARSSPSGSASMRWRTRRNNSSRKSWVLPIPIHTVIARTHYRAVTRALHGASSHWQLHCLCTNLFRLTMKITSKLCIIVNLWGNPAVIGATRVKHTANLARTPFCPPDVKQPITVTLHGHHGVWDNRRVDCCLTVFQAGNKRNINADPLRRWSGDSPHKGPVIWIPCPRHDVVMFVIPPHNEVVGVGGYIGFTPSVRPSVRLSVRASRARFVAPTVLVGSISYLCILSTNFRRCVPWKVYSKISKFEFLAIFWNL